MKKNELETLISLCLTVPGFYAIMKDDSDSETET